MSNILAITQKELKGYFASPIAYIVIGLYALIYGFFFYSLVLYFDRQSMQMVGLGAGAPPVNVNENMIRPAFLNAMVVFLFVLPMITMRTYSEEKRSGTIELLLTSPLTDFQIIMGKFLGAMGLFAAMMAVTLPHIAILFAYGNPEWKPIVTSYLGLLLFGGCFIARPAFERARQDERQAGERRVLFCDRRRGLALEVHAGFAQSFDEALIAIDRCPRADALRECRTEGSATTPEALERLAQTRAGPCASSPRASAPSCSSVTSCTSGSAWRWTSRHSDPSRRKTSVRRSDKSCSGRSPTRPRCRSIATRTARSPDA